MTEKVFTVEVEVHERPDRAWAKALLDFDGNVRGGWGRARRNPADPERPRLGEELAVARALADLAHQLGLVANDTHQRTSHARHHCTELTCLMAQPTWRVYARNAFGGLFNHFPSDYCARCQEDIRRAQTAWSERLVREPGYREKRASDIRTWYVSLAIRPLVERGEYESALASLEPEFCLPPDVEALHGAGVAVLTTVLSLEHGRELHGMGVDYFEADDARLAVEAARAAAAAT